MTVSPDQEQGGIAMKVAIYARVSGRSNRQDAANQSLQLVEYCQRQGWEYVEYTDRMSGIRADRTAFLKMFEDARHIGKRQNYWLKPGYDGWFQPELRHRLFIEAPSA
jgi:predicted site-specific integrase-resolvase